MKLNLTVALLSGERQAEWSVLKMEAHGPQRQQVVAHTSWYH